MFDREHEMDFAVADKQRMCREEYDAQCWPGVHARNRWEGTREGLCSACWRKREREKARYVEFCAKLRVG